MSTRMTALDQPPLADRKAVKLTVSKRRPDGGYRDYSAITKIRPKHPWALTAPHGVLHLVVGGRGIWDAGEMYEYYIRFGCGAESSRPHFYWDPPEDAPFCDECLLGDYEEPMVYRAFDASGQPLYIGYSSRVDKRLKVHSRSSVWWPAAVRFELSRFPTERDALRAEDAEIKQHRPKHNVRSKPKD